MANYIGIGNSMTTFAKTLKAELDGLKKEYEQYWRPSKTDSTSRVLTVSKAIERHTRERIARLENIWAQDYAEGRT
jgi:hypothetical protein